MTDLTIKTYGKTTFNSIFQSQTTSFHNIPNIIQMSKPNYKLSENNASKLENSIPIKSTKYKYKSIANIIDNLREEIKERYTSIDLEKIAPKMDQISLISFQEKFVENKEKWNSCMENIIKITDTLEKQYEIKNFFGLKHRYLYTILNISISYIIDPDRTDAKINKFILTLPEQFEKLEENAHQAKILEGSKMKYLGEQNRKISNLESLKRIIRNQEANLRKNLDLTSIETINVDLKQKKEQLKREIELYQNINNKLSECEQKYDEIYVKNRDIINNLFDIIDFNYFNKKLYCPSLDHGLISELDDNYHLKCF